MGSISGWETKVSQAASAAKKKKKKKKLESKAHLQQLNCVLFQFPKGFHSCTYGYDFTLKYLHKKKL